jgi:hypothetical protein
MGEGVSKELFRRVTGMRQVKIALALACTIALSGLAHAQDSPSLGDVARQVRQQKQDKDAKGKAAPDAKPARVITENEMPEHPEIKNQTVDGGASAASEEKHSAEEWKSQITEQQNLVHQHEAELTKLNDSIRFAPGNCVSGCAQWNERQKEKQDQVERLQTQLDEDKKHLDDMQEGARQEGYGSSVYEP